MAPNADEARLIGARLILRAALLAPQGDSEEAAADSVVEAFEELAEAVFEIRWNDRTSSLQEG